MGDEEIHRDDRDADDPTVTLRVTPLTSDPFDVVYSADHFRAELRPHLDRATAIVCCPADDVLTPITGGVPRQMPACPRCRQAMEGVVEVEVVDAPEAVSIDIESPYRETDGEH